MKTIAILICVVAISVFGLTGCATSSTPPTREAIVFYTFQDTWTATHKAYQAYCEMVVLGKVSKADEKDIDAAWNSFRSGFSVALMAAHNDWSAATPATVEKLKDDFITIIRSLP